MRLSFLVVLVACKGGEPTVPDVAFDFKAMSTPDAVIADIPDEAVDAWDAIVGLHANISLISTDTLVRDLLATGGMPVPGCWMSIAPNSISVDLDFDGCQPIQANGDVTVTRLPAASAVAYQPTSAFSYNNRRVQSGEFVFTPLSGITWRTAGAVWADGAAPTDLITTAIEDRTFDIALAGRARYNSLANEFSYWGTATVSGQEIWFGAETLEDAETEAFPDNALTDNFLDDCRCATDGSYTLPTTLQATQVMLDLNRSLEDAGTVWPTILVETTATVEGMLTIEPGNQCGRLKGAFVPSGDLAITGAELQAGVELACTTNAFQSEEACEQMRIASGKVTEHGINLGDRVNGDMVKEMVERLMEPEFCTLNVQN